LSVTQQSVSVHSSKKEKKKVAFMINVEAQSLIIADKHFLSGHHSGMTLAPGG